MSKKCAFLAIIAVLFACEAVHAKKISTPKSDWYTFGKFDEAVEMAKESGRPLAMMWQDPNSTCGLHNRQRARWKNMKELEAFVRIMLNAKQPSPKLFATIRKQGREKQGKYIPMLFLGTSTGKFLDVIPYKTEKEEAVAKINSALKKFTSAKVIRGLISEAEASLAQENYGEAASKVQEVKDAKDVAKELLAMADVVFGKITQATEKELAEAEKFIGAEDYVLADRALARIEKTYKDLPVGAKAAELLKEMRGNPKIVGIINSAAKEEKARRMLDRGEKAYAEGRYAKALAQYDKLCKEHSNTKAGKTAAEKAAAIRSDSKIMTTMKNRLAKKDCQRMLSMANSYIANRMSSKARVYLQEIIEKYPDTEFAQEAKKKLGTLE